MKQHNDLIMELPGFIPEHLCTHIINEYEKCPDNEKIEGRVLYNTKSFVDKSLKNSTEISIENLIKGNIGDWKKMNEKLHNYIKLSTELYTKYLVNEYPGPINLENNQKLHTFESTLTAIKNDGVGQFDLVIQRQPKKAKYAWHYDYHPPQSYLFGIIYLNTLKPEEGGQTTFLSGRQIRPEAGKIMLSPASWTYAHSATEVKADYKYIIPFHVYHGNYHGENTYYYWWPSSTSESKYP